MSVVYMPPPGVDGTVVYQRYYAIGLERIAPLRFEQAPLRTRLARGASRKVDLLAPPRPIRLARRLARRPGVPGEIGRYELRENGRVRRFVIDATDNHVLRHPSLVDEVDVYFKANRWRHADYPARVLPVVNGNGFVTPKRIDVLRELRSVPKSVDVAFISNIWGGSGHNVRLFEELAASGVRADLLAVLPLGWPVDEAAEVERRLDAAGVGLVRKPVGLAELWRRLARSRVVVIRWGKHLCIPWRMIDLLAMGSCILFDAEPLPQWPVPLESGIHFASMGIDRSFHEPPADGEYGKVGPALRLLLDDSDRRSSLSSAAVDYFERHARPEAVARYVLDTVRGVLPA